MLPTIAAGSVDAVVCDPPYPEIDRPYGRLTEAAWAEMMRDIVREVRRVLAPPGSAVFILQPNSERVGRMRPWMWDFLSWCCREWNVVQDAYWWNHTAMPTVCSNRRYGLMRPSLKYCVWLGDPDCYRDQGAVLWEPSAAGRMASVERRTRVGRESYPSGWSVNHAAMGAGIRERGGVTPFNVLPVANTDSQSSAGAYGHGAGTPVPLCAWWVRYLCPPGGLVCDPFSGLASTGVAALQQGRRYLGIERSPEYADASRRRLGAAQPALAVAI